MIDPPRLRVLIVEDEVIIGMDLELLVREAGHESVAIAMDAHGALQAAREARPDLALVDLDLRDGLTGPEIMRALTRDYGVTGLFVTANRTGIPDDFAGALGALEKPFDRTTLVSAVRWAADRRLGRAMSDAPRGLEIAPAKPDAAGRPALRALTSAG